MHRKMLGTTAVTVRVESESQIAEARWVAARLAEEIGMVPVIVAHVVTSVSELATNLFFHATRGGTITITPLRRKGRVGIEIVAEDDGPGIPNLRIALQDGFSTNHGLGCGLSGVKRLMDEFEIQSRVGRGTRVVARKWRQ